MPKEVVEWLNENQGFVAALGVLVVILGWITGLFKFLWRLVFGSPKDSSSSSIIAGNVRPGRDAIASENVNIVNINIAELNISDLEKQQRETLAAKAEHPEEVGRSTGPGSSTARSGSEDFQKVMALITGEPTRERKSKLRALFYSSDDNSARLQAAISLAQLAVLPEDSLSDLVVLCDEGIKIAEFIKAQAEKALLLAYRGRYLSAQFSVEDTQGASIRQASEFSGVPLVTPEQREQTVRRLHQLDDLAGESFAQAEKLAIESGSVQALALVRSLIGQAAGQRYIHLNYFGVPRGEEEKQLSKKALLSAKNLYASVGDELGVAYTLHNLAIQLRTFGEIEEARQLIEQVIEVAAKHDQQKLLRKAQTLREELVEPGRENGSTGEEPE